ncbi:hypothetical protein K491DRAFT_715429 [Lophiostoma macrostomum CBS 122681]|uniref:Actin-like ATPase domain-containing protein n=1 Tax=Lophiostoma macrostomum CBS 122681 TaxID=1314788 RepID=A0A6A6TBU5_9PLEO|nr:hypothetical protein K491DRAFT_715429 [Lophiostoma macrostomum CBS 122681]
MAMQVLEFGCTTRGEPNLTLVNEAEAAALHLLHCGQLEDLMPRDRFAVVDCGGGTTDSGVYQLREQRPLRLKKEILPPNGIAIGAASLDDRLFDLVSGDISKHNCIDPALLGNRSIESYIREFIMLAWEHRKRSVELTTREEKVVFMFPGMKSQSDTRGRVQDGRYVLSYDDLCDIFKDWIQAVTQLTGDVIQLAFDKGMPLNKVMFVGGGSDAAALRRYVVKEIESNSSPNFSQESPKWPRLTDGARGVAAGAVERVADKSHSPKRFTTISIGVEKIIPAVNDEVTTIKDRYFTEVQNKTDELYSYPWCVEWLLKKGQGPLPAEYKLNYQDFFDILETEESWRDTLKFHVSEECTEDFYQLHHPKNRGKTKQLGRLEIDLGFLKGTIVLQRREDGKGSFYMVGPVIVDMVLTNHHLEFKASYKGKALEGSEANFNITAAFHHLEQVSTSR